MYSVVLIFVPLGAVIRILLHLDARVVVPEVSIVSFLNAGMGGRGVPSNWGLLMIQVETNHGARCRLWVSMAVI